MDAKDHQSTGPPAGTTLPTEKSLLWGSNWKRAQISLLIQVIAHAWRDRPDFYVGGSMCLYYSAARDPLGLDFFVVKGAVKNRVRRGWITWEEDGKYPDLIIDLAATAAYEPEPQKTLYEGTFRTPEYFIYAAAERQLAGWRLAGGRYQPLTPTGQGWVWSEELALWLGGWSGHSDNGEYNHWLRFYESNGRLLPTPAEAAQAQAEQEAQRRAQAEATANTEAQALAQAKAKIAVLQAELNRLKKRSG